MNHSPSKILIILTIIFLVPIALYTVFEINSLNEDELMIKEIYSNQLDAILFSVNQASNDIMDTWSKRIIEIEKQSDSLKIIEYETLMEDYLAINAVIFFRESPKWKTKIYHKPEFKITKTYEKGFWELMTKNSGRIRQLTSYLENNYRKMEPLGRLWLKENDIPDNLVVFALDKGNEFGFVALSLDPEYFIEQTLSPKIQAISQDKFIVGILNGFTKDQIYATEDVEVADKETAREFWLFPNYFLHIELKGKTMENLVNERAYTNIMLLAGLILVLLAGVWLVFSNISKALQLAQAKSDFVSNVSHEIRTPLALIHMFAETLELDRITSEEKKKEYYQIIGQEANRLTGIVNRILSFSKMEADKYEYHMTEVDLNHLLSKILKTYEYHLKNNNFEYHFRLSDDKLIINADVQTLEEVIINILDNAMKFSNDHKFIEIYTGIDANHAFLAIKDKGVGISKEDQNRIFNKFYRVAKGEVQNTKGTGLGLSLVKQIVDAHQGRLEVESKPGKGSTFSVFIPLKKIK